MSTPAYPLVVHPSQIARTLGIPLPLDEDTRYVLEEASRGAQSDLEAYLGRPVIPATYTQEHCWLTPRGWHHLKNYPVVSITSFTPETGPGGQQDGLFTVVYVAGLDATDETSRELEPIRRFIKIHALYDPAVQVVFRTQRPDIAFRVTSGSVQGETATITDTYPATSSAAMRSPAAVTAQMSMPGSPPTLQTCDRWRISKRRVFQRPTRPGDAAIWPYDLPLPGTWDVWAGRWVTWW
jgi:hypothetical protein